MSETSMTALATASREGWIAGALWALKDQGVDVNVYVREAVRAACPIEEAAA